MADLSPAAQAVLDAADSVFDQAGTTRQGIAAALKAAADQVVPEGVPKNRAINLGMSFWDARDDVRAELLAIAAELEEP